jgi:hypothetical protein
MSWLFSQVLVVEYLGDTFLDGEPSALSNGKNTQLAYLPQDKMTDFSRLSRFGMMFKPLTESLGEELLMSYRAAFHAKTLVQQERGGGITGSRSSMWKQMARIIGEVQPQYAFIENSPMLTRRGLESVLCDLAKMGFDAEWGCISASDFGANHERERIWIVASNTNLPQFKRRSISSGVHKKNSKFSNSCWWKDSSNVYRMDDGVAARVDRLKAIGNGQVPQVAAVAWELLTERLNARI